MNAQQAYRESRKIFEENKRGLFKTVVENIEEATQKGDLSVSIELYNRSNGIITMLAEELKNLLFGVTVREIGCDGHRITISWEHCK